MGKINLALNHLFISIEPLFYAYKLLWIIFYIVLVNAMMQIAVLEEQKKMAVGKAENEPSTETGQSTDGPTTMTQETRGELNMNEASEEAAQVRMLNRSLSQMACDFRDSIIHLSH